MLLLDDVRSDCREQIRWKIRWKSTRISPSEPIGWRGEKGSRQGSPLDWQTVNREVRYSREDQGQFRPTA